MIQLTADNSTYTAEAQQPNAFASVSWNIRTLSLNSAHISMPFSRRESIAMEMPGTDALFVDFPAAELKLHNLRLHA